MTSDIYGAPAGYPRQPGRGLGILLSAVLVLSALWIGLVSTALLTIVTPAVLPGASFSVPGVSGALEQLPGGLSVSAPDADHPFNQPVSVLVMGVDRRPGESELSVRTDSIAVIRLDPVTHKATILSVPRDMWISINPPDGGSYWQRVNVSYSEGAAAGGSIDAGAEQLMRDLEVNFGIHVDHYVWLEMSGAGTLIDAMGGVDVEIPESLAVPEWRYTEDDVTNPRNVEFPPGKHHLSGYEAVAFSRYRGDSDLFRAQRQQLVLRALLKDPISPAILLNPFDAWNAATSTIESDLSLPGLAGIAFLAGRASGDTQLFSLGEPVNGAPTVIPITTESGAQVLDWNAGNVAYWVEQARATR